MTENRFIDSAAAAPLAEVVASGHPGDTSRALVHALNRFGEGVWRFYPLGEKDPLISLEVSSAVLVDLEIPQRRSVLHRALLKEPLLKSKEIERFERRGLEQQQCPGILCLEEGKIDSTVAAESIALEISADLLSVLHAGEGVWRGPHLSSIGSGLREFVDLGLTPEQALLRSARQNGLWDRIGELPLLREVVTASPSAFGLVSDPKTSAEARSLLESADGLQDLSALTSHRADPWRALDRALELLGAGHLQFQSAMHLFQLGEQKLAAGDLEVALRHWRRAEEKGLDDFDLAGRIGQICAKSDRHTEAMIRLRQHARKSMEQLRFAAARESWTELAILDPQHSEAVDRAVQLWIKEPSADLTTCFELAGALSACGQWRALAELAEGVGVQNTDPHLHEWHEKAARELGDEEMEQRARWRRAECLRTGDDPFDAICHYQKLLASEFDVVRVSLRLAELLLQQSKVTEAKEVLAPLSSGRWRNDFWNDEELQRILEACAEFEGVPVSVLDLLHQLALECGDTNASKKYLLRLMSHSESEAEVSLAEYRTRVWLGDHPGDFEMLEQLLTLLSSRATDYRASAFIDSVIDGMKLSAEDRSRLLSRWVESDPSHPRALYLLLTEGFLEESTKAEYFRRASLRAVADGVGIPWATHVGLSKDEEWRTPILKALFSQGTPPMDHVAELLNEMTAGANYLQSLLLEKISLDPETRKRVQGLQSAPLNSGNTRASVVRTGLGGITEKLKNMGSSAAVTSEGASLSREKSAEKSAPEEVPAKILAQAPVSAGPGVQSALHRLKAMRQPAEADGIQTPAPVEKNITVESQRPDPPAPAPKAKVNAAIARLGALRNGENLSTGVDEEGNDA